MNYKRLLSAIILTKNEEKNIVDCIDSVRFADEIFIVDDHSDDRTVELAQRASDKVQVFKYHLSSDFSKSRNFALSKVNTAWVLFLDADERITKGLREEILLTLLNHEALGVKGFKIKREDFLWGEKLEYGEQGNTKLLRLGLVDAGIWSGKVHETWRIKGKIGLMQNSIYHYPHPTMSEFISDINRYSSIRASELHEQKTSSNWFVILFYPFAKFVLNYFIKQGFRDGTAGFVAATLMSFHSFLVRSKLFLLYKKN